MQSFLINSQETPEQAALRKKQAVAQALSQPAQNMGQGIGQLGTGLVAAYQNNMGQPQQTAAGLGSKVNTSTPGFMDQLKMLLGGGAGGGY